ncbi:MAG: DUF4190 domain-containing protein [Firmicutes bacterium]|nr:DUF4190 domain-containing protein [Bacillota bacterium]
MDEQNYGNQQNGGGNDTGSQSGNYYQDYTANTQQYQPPQNDGPNKANGLQIASLVLGILGIPGCCCYGVVGLLCGIVGLVLAMMGNKQNRGSGIGIAGLVCSIVSIFLGILATVYYALILMGMFGSGPLADMIRDMGYSMYY